VLPFTSLASRFIAANLSTSPLWREVSLSAASCAACGGEIPHPGVCSGNKIPAPQPLESDFESRSPSQRAPLNCHLRERGCTMRAPMYDTFSSKIIAPLYRVYNCVCPFGGPLVVKPRDSRSARPSPLRPRRRFLLHPWQIDRDLYMQRVEKNTPFQILLYTISIL
jgi:hypothetical protein